MCKVSRQQEKVVNYVFESPFTALDSAASFFRLKQNAGPSQRRCYAEL